MCCTFSVALFCFVFSLLVFVVFWLDPKSFSDKQDKDISPVLFFTPRFWLLHAMQVTCGTARWWWWGRCGVKLVLASHVLSPFFSTFPVQYVLLSQNSSAGSRKARSKNFFWTEQQAIPPSSDVRPGHCGPPKTRMTDKLTYLPLQRPLHAASIRKTETAEQTTASASAPEQNSVQTIG